MTLVRGAHGSAAWAAGAMTTDNDAAGHRGYREMCESAVTRDPVAASCAEGHEFLLRIAK